MNRLEDLGFPAPSTDPSSATAPTSATAEIPPTVLFVDDEPEVLAGLRLSLRRLRDRYHLRFAQSADEAIAVLESELVDMVITDMRMPGRSGADLLDELRFRFPEVIRYVLSGQAEDRLVRRSVAVTHRWLGKPCEPEVLIDAITEAVGHRSSLADPVLRRAVGSVDALPTHPVIHARLIDALAIDDAGPEPVAALVANDPAMLVKLLQWANSAYGTDGAIFDARRAVDRIGTAALERLAPANDIIRPFYASEVIPGFGIDLFHRHGRSVSAIAAALVTPEWEPVAAAGGLLSHLGLLIEVAQRGDHLNLAYRRALADGLPLVEVERSFIGAGHPELAAHLLALWGLPRQLVEIVAGGHGRPDPAAALPLSPVEAVKAARFLATRLPLAAAVGPPHLPTVDDELTGALDRWEAGIHPDRWQSVTGDRLTTTG